jgi:hypothetical protein
MNENGTNPETERTTQSGAHEEFLQLCALFTTDSLTEDERSRVEGHVSVCSACSDALKDYERIAGVVLPAFGPDFVPAPNSAPILGSTASAKRKLLEQIRSESPSTTRIRPSGAVESHFAKRWYSFPIQPLRNLFALWHREPIFRYAAGGLLVVGLTFSAYRLGEERTARLFDSGHQLHEESGQSLQQQVNVLTRDGQTLADELHQRDQVIQTLNHQNNLQLADVARLKEIEATLQSAIHKAQATTAQVSSERDGLGQQLKSAQANLDQVSEQLGVAQAKFTKTQQDLDNLRQKRDADSLRLTSLEAHIAELSERLKGRDDTIAQQQQLLASDRDIRELMGARDLYLAEVYDVARNGENEKPFGRVFFTKNKSLIFYAYDLDQQPGIKNASAFQAWGRGPDRTHAVSLGIFYMDNLANKRWVLKVDDPQTLQQIDYVFVTVEPKGGSPEPSRNKLLFAYLRVPPNHP